MLKTYKKLDENVLQNPRHFASIATIFNDLAQASHVQLYLGSDCFATLQHDAVGRRQK